MIDHKDEDNDLVRTGHSPDYKKDRAALINDPRNDSNLIVSQIHVAFLRAHNQIVDRLTCTFEDARRILQKHYQWMIFNDLLPRFVRAGEIEAARYKPLWEKPDGVPLEFSVAAYRFGHSLVRTSYYLNDTFPRVPLKEVFMLTVLSNGLKPTPGEGCLNLPGNQIIQWRKFLEGGDSKNTARQIRPQMVEPLFALLNEANVEVKGEKRLAVQDLKRGYMMRIPTGQAIAERIGIKKEEVLTSDDFQKYAPKQFDVLKTSEFLTKTPLWFHVLTEAAKQLHVAGKDQLGPVGGRIVAEAIAGFIRQTPDSFLNTGWEPRPDFCFQRNKFLITDLLHLAGVLEKP